MREQELNVDPRYDPELVPIVEEDHVRSAVASPRTQLPPELYLGDARLYLSVARRYHVRSIGLVRAVRIDHPETGIRDRRP